MVAAMAEIALTWQRSRLGSTIEGTSECEMVCTQVFPNQNLELPPEFQKKKLNTFSPGRITTLEALVSTCGNPDWSEKWDGEMPKRLGFQGKTYWWGKAGVVVDAKANITHLLSRSYPDEEQVRSSEKQDSSAAGPRAGIAAKPDAENWPFRAALPAGFHVEKRDAKKGVETWVLQGEQDGQITRTLFVLRWKNEGKKGIAGDCAFAAKSAAELAVGLPVGSSKVDVSTLVRLSSSGKLLVLELGSGPDSSCLIQTGKGRNGDSIRISCMATTGKAGESCTAVGGAAKPEVYSSLRKAACDLCEQLRLEGGESAGDERNDSNQSNPKGKEFAIPQEKLSEKDQRSVKEPQSPIPDRGAHPGPTVSGRALVPCATRDLFLLLQVKDAQKEIKVTSKQLEIVKEIAAMAGAWRAGTRPASQTLRPPGGARTDRGVERRDREVECPEPKTTLAGASTRWPRLDPNRWSRPRAGKGYREETVEHNIKAILNPAIEAAEASPAPSCGVDGIPRRRGAKGTECGSQPAAGNPEADSLRNGQALATPDADPLGNDRARAATAARTAWRCGAKPIEKRRLIGPCHRGRGRWKEAKHGVGSSGKPPDGRAKGEV